ncbi:MAG: hypothetical protein FWF03_01990 [Defluviitaleaceae bacterium]|nr:hypothetical protein [Defluviitaleaceae bacterium]
MEQLTGYERTRRMLKREKGDRIGAFEHFWGDTRKAYVDKGKIKPEENLNEHFDYDIVTGGWNNLVIDLDFKPEVVEETEETVLTRDGNGALLRRHKKHDTTPEHVDFAVKCREDWNKVRGMLLEPDERRINFEGYRSAKQYAKEHKKFFMSSGVNVFELMHPVCGHEYMLMGMALDPEWIEDMVKVYSDLSLALQDILFAKEGLPDGVWYYEDMGFKNRPFMSPQMYMDLIFPAHKRTFGYARERKLPVTVHSCGYVEPLIPGLLEAGMDCLQVIEIKAGMDLLRIYKEYGDRLSLMGGIDVRTLYSNDRAVIDRELESKIPIVKKNYGYCLHSDHSIPNQVDYETLIYFYEKAFELGKHE